MARYLVGETTPELEHLRAARRHSNLSVNRKYPPD